MSSIVEKAVGRGSPERRQVVAAAPVATGPGPEVTQLPAPEGPPLALRALSMIEQFPALARDFRFLKRPVLARVFGLSRAAPQGGNVVMITSDLPSAGKSFLALNLAASMASEQMTRVLLVDADPVRHSLSTRLGVAGRGGLLDLLAAEAASLADVMLPTDVDSLFVLPAGRQRPDANELLASPRMSALLKSFNDPNLVVLLDSPPLLLSSEGRVLADKADHALVVVEAGRSTTGDVSQVLQLLKGSTATVSMVLNKAPVAGSARYKDYYYPYADPS